MIKSKNQNRIEILRGVIPIVRRIYVEKREDLYAEDLCREIRETLGIDSLESIRYFKRYDIEGLNDAQFEKTLPIVFYEPPVDRVFLEELPDLKSPWILSIGFLAGQYDQRADSAAQCVQLVTQEDRPTVQTARTFAFFGKISARQFNRIKKYLINEIDSRVAEEEKPQTLEQKFEIPKDVEILEDFTTLDKSQLEKFHADRGFSMSLEDLEFCQKYFKENHAPTITELRVIDTYWSDHCRHTTFTSAIDEVIINDERIQKAFDEYLTAREKIYEEPRDISLMDLGTIAAKILKREGKLKHLDQSEEINACSIEIESNGDPWLVMFKNETHNHPTEIEPFGGAATCLGGAIRDPLSGRSYVYQSMRITGAADPRTPIDETLPGKLPQKKISREAANGFSSYGNQIGLATGLVREIYHPNYVAKRMEIGAVIAAAPKSNVVRARPAAGDLILLVGGRTGRDGCGGATGSSREHHVDSLTTRGAEVQKGNPPTERKLQRLFRNPEASRLIKRCNDFGAGGVSVAIGELARGLEIDLDAVPKKYEGLDGTELAISESQERMAVVIDPKSLEKFKDLAAEENLEAALVARVTDDDILTMTWRGKKIVELDRKFLDTNGVKQHVEARIPQQFPAEQKLTRDWFENLRDLNVASQKGLIEKFDSTIGASTVLMPLGGKTQLTPQNGMAAKIPNGSSTATVMTFGFDPFEMSQDQFRGAVISVVTSLAKLTAMGADSSKAYLTFQEYFERLGKDPNRWGKPLSALLGAFIAQIGMEVAAIGGKDSMSGSFENLDVPPTLVSFAVAAANSDEIISSEFKSSGNRIYFFNCDDIFDFESIRKNFSKIHELILDKKIISAMAVESGGISAAISKMCLGNLIGAKIDTDIDLFDKKFGSIILESTKSLEDFIEIGRTISDPKIIVKDSEFPLDKIREVYIEPLEKIFPTRVKNQKSEEISNSTQKISKSKIKIAKPRVFIPTFPGTNCEIDSARAFESAGAIPQILVIKNLTSKDVEESVARVAKSIDQSQILMFPGGFSGGDEPDGSGKFIAAMFRNPRIVESIEKFLDRDGLILGICNGFQALLKLGLLPFGKIRPLTENDPTLTFNTIGRHVSCMVRTRIASKLSPWLAEVDLNSEHTIAVSHGEGRFIANQDVLEKLKLNGQIATQYIDNPNGSIWNIEGITSPDGKIFGKMGHSERIGVDVAKNIPGDKDQKIFRAGVKYFEE